MRQKYGRILEYTWVPSEVTPVVGELCVTSRGLGYLVVRVRPSRTSGEALGNYRVTVVTVDPRDPGLRDFPRRTWTWHKVSA